MFECLIWQDRFGVNIPKTTSKVYRDVVDLILRRYCQRMRRPDVKIQIESCFQPLDKLALQGLLASERGLIFDSETIHHVLQNRTKEQLVYNSGLLSKVKSRSKFGKSFMLSFPHKCIQEYFAGIYIASVLSQSPGNLHVACETDANIQQFLADMKCFDKLVNMQNVLLHACTSPSLTATESLLAMLHQTVFNGEQLSDLFSNSFSSAEEVLDICTSFHFKQFNFIVSSCLNEICQMHTLQPKHLHSLNGIVTASVEHFGDSLMQLPVVKQHSFKCLSLDINIFNLHSILPFMASESFEDLEYLGLGIVLEDPPTKLVESIKELTAKNEKLRAVRIASYAVEPKICFQNVFPTPLQCDQLEILDVENLATFPSDVDFSLLPRLSVLHFDNIGATFEAYTGFFKALKYTQNMKSLHWSFDLEDIVNIGWLKPIGNQQLDPDYILCESLSHMKNLQHLKLEYVFRSSLGVLELGKIIAKSSFPQLRTLLIQIPNNSITGQRDPSTDYINLFKSLCHVPYLTKINLSRCCLQQCSQKHNVIQALANTLHSIPNLEELELRGNNIGDSLACLIGSLQHVPKLKVLGLSGNVLGPGGLKNLTEALKKNLHYLPDLKMLDLSSGAPPTYKFTSYEIENLQHVVKMTTPLLFETEYADPEETSYALESAPDCVFVNKES